jgi:hypothetical protein
MTFVALKKTERILALIQLSFTVAIVYLKNLYFKTIFNFKMLLKLVCWVHKFIHF